MSKKNKRGRKRQKKINKGSTKVEMGQKGTQGLDGVIKG